MREYLRNQMYVAASWNFQSLREREKKEFSGFIGTARLCPHSFPPPVAITDEDHPIYPLHEELVII
ncbi:hypothetical protein J6590_063567 [Homalodisca vitripennis]|nr:hypothetical protein J6590_063567 [Homalodisca vitripennis]